MKAHERIQVSNTRLINKVEIQRIVCERNGQEVNWAMFVEWTIRDQLRRLNHIQKVGQNGG
jgi:hypothetical protein